MGTIGWPARPYGFRRPIRADFPWTFLSTNPCFNARVFFLDRDDPFQFNGRGRRI